MKSILKKATLSLGYLISSLCLYSTPSLATAQDEANARNKALYQFLQQHITPKREPAPSRDLVIDVESVYCFFYESASPSCFLQGKDFNISFDGPTSQSFIDSLAGVGINETAAKKLRKLSCKSGIFRHPERPPSEVWECSATLNLPLL